ncbi:MAG: hypothetical protein KIS75_12350 [Chromatiales bacterium]|nr:hypothetical protein [Chromatiales bacterium]
MIAIGTPAVAVTDAFYSTAVAIGGGKFVAIYRDASLNVGSIVGSIDSGGNITYGSPVATVASANNPVVRQACIAGTDKICLLWYSSSDNYIKAQVGTISGTTISWGSSTNIVSVGGPRLSACAWDPVNEKVLVYADDQKLYVGTVSGSTISFGSASAAVPSDQEYDGTVAISYDPSSGKFLLLGSFWANGYGGYEESYLIEYSVITISGTTASWGAQVIDGTDIACYGGALAYDSDNGNHVFIGMRQPNAFVQTPSAYVVSVSGTTAVLGSLQTFTAAGNGPNTGQLVYDNGAFLFPRQWYGGSPTYLKLATSDGSELTFQLDEDDPSITDEYGSSFTLIRDPGTGHSIALYHEPTTYYLNAVAVDYQAPEGDPSCYVKPKLEIEESSFIPGEPGYVGQPYAPAYCLPPHCYQVALSVIPIGGSSGGYYQQECVTYPDDTPGFGGYTTQCTMVFVPGGGGVSGAVPPSTNYTTICLPPVCYPEQPYIPPLAPTPPTPAVYSIEYNLGWNWDLILGSGDEIAWTITTDNVPRESSGIAVGITNNVNAALDGIGKYFVHLLFEGNNVSIFEGATRVWGAVFRAADDEFTIQRSGAQIAVLRNGVVEYAADVFTGYEAVLVASVYKGGDGLCLLQSSILSSADPVGTTSSCDIDLPALSAFAGEGSQADAAFTLPALSIDAGAYNHGEADIDLPALFAIGAEGSFGWAMMNLPALTAQGAAAGAGSTTGEGVHGGTAALVLPSLEVFSGSGDQADGNIILPALTVSGDGGFASPSANGADISLPYFLGAAHGLTGEIGGVDVTLEPLDMLAGEGTYGEFDQSLPALTLIAGQYPAYDGVLYGQVGSLQVIDFYGFLGDGNSFYGRIGTLAGAMYGGAQASGAVGALSGSLTGTLDVLGRLSGRIGTLSGELTGTGGAVSALVGSLGLGLSGSLYGGGELTGNLPALAGDMTGTPGAVGVLSGALQGLSGTLSGTKEEVGRLVGQIGELGALWGILEGTIVSLNGEFVESEVTVSEYVAWVMNLAHNGVTRYPAYPFDFVVRFQGKHYLANSSGIYELGAADDDGEPIDAEFGLPPSDFGSTQEKRCPRLYIKGKLGGQMAVSIQADEGDTYTSNTEGNAGVDYWRAKMPRGLKGHNLKFNVANVDGSDFEIEHVDALIHLLGRKI